LQLKEDFIIVDAGAADGRSSLKFAHNFKQSKIIAFEPVSQMCELFKEKTQHLSNVILIKKALGNSISKVKVNITKNFESSSILQLNTQYNKNTDFTDELGFQNTETVDLTTLDEELKDHKNIGLIKIDTQGAELMILQGASQTLKKTKIILLEMNNHDSYKNAAKYYQVDIYLRNSDFRLYDLIPALRNKERIYEWDAIYLQSKYF